jgi:hypothetical protein
MQVFLVLFAICLAGGFALTGIIWIIFWAIGIFECPEEIRVFMLRGGKKQLQKIESAPWLGTVCVESARQTQGSSLTGLAQMDLGMTILRRLPERPMFKLEGLRESQSPGRPYAAAHR